MPDTKPDLFFDEEGVCDACRSAELKKTIDWNARKKEFEELIEKYRNKSGSNYDCLIPISGGKDSHYQVYIAKKVYGLNPLLVHFEPTMRTALGKNNLDNIKQSFGVDMLVFEKNPEVYKKMVIEGFRRVGDSEWPNHLGIFTVPVNIAVKFKIPLIIWGENAQLEYGGPKAARMKNVLDRRWLEEFGGLLGNRTEDMLNVEGITKKDLIPYIYPSDEDLKEAGITGIYLGYYFHWDARRQVEIVKQCGFNIKEDGAVEGTYTNYENLDEATVGLHDYLKFTKYGFGRATDHACLDIRNGRITRAEGKELVKKYDGKYPYYAIKSFMEYSSLSKEEIDKTIDSFTNKQIFKLDEKDNFTRDIAGNLIKNNYDNEPD